MFQKVEGDQSQNFLTPTVQAFLIILTSAIRSLIKRNGAGRWQGSRADNWPPSSSSFKNSHSFARHATRQTEMPTL